jgi:hypothetical protein
MLTARATSTSRNGACWRLATVNSNASRHRTRVGDDTMDFRVTGSVQPRARTCVLCALREFRALRSASREAPRAACLRATRSEHGQSRACHAPPPRAMCAACIPCTASADACGRDARSGASVAPRPPPHWTREWTALRPATQDRLSCHQTSRLPDDENRIRLWISGRRRHFLPRKTQPVLPVRHNSIDNSCRVRSAGSASTRVARWASRRRSPPLLASRGEVCLLRPACSDARVDVRPAAKRTRSSRALCRLKPVGEDHVKSSGLGKRFRRPATARDLWAPDSLSAGSSSLRERVL